MTTPTCSSATSPTARPGRPGTAAAGSASRSRPPGNRLVDLGVVGGASLLLGALTALAQGAFPAALGPLANSASSWTLLTALLVWTVRRGPAWSAVLGAIGFVALTCGYAVVANVLGHYFDPLWWCLVGVVSGPFVGVAAAWQADLGWRRAVGTGLLAGILVGEPVWGLTVLAATTSWVGWALLLAVGAGMAAWAARRLAALRLVAAELVVLGLVALALGAVYRVLS